MRRAVLLALFLLCAFAIVLSQPSPVPAAPVKVKIRAALFDRDLNLKPVPRLVINLTPKVSGPPLTTQTSLDGVAELELPLGAYQLTTDKPAELFGKQYLWDLAITISKADQVVELSNDNAKVTDSAAARGAHVDELAEQFKRVRGSVVTVWTEGAVDDGFLVDPAGLVFTSHFVIEGHKWIAVQFDGGRRLAAEVLVDDETNNVAFLRISTEPLKDIVVPGLSLDPGALLEGERVFAIDNSSKRGKVMSTGVISKADAKEIVSDVKFTDLASPLFNSSGSVVGYSRIINKEMRIIPLAEVREDIARARQKLAAATNPAPSRLLPVAPTGDFPVDSLLSRPETRFEKEIYFFKLGDFEVNLMTPVANYQLRQERYTEAVQQRIKQKGGAAAKVQEPEHNYESILRIWARPQMKYAFWKSWGDSMGSNNQAPRTFRPKDSFSRLRLLCGDKEVEPILPGKLAMETPSDRFVRIDENAFYGFYSYTPDAVSPSCGKVTLEVYSASQPEKPLVKVLDPDQVNRLWQDFEPYRKLQAGAPAAPLH
jgi:trypsin-like peptidase